MSAASRRRPTWPPIKYEPHDDLPQRTDGVLSSTRRFGLGSKVAGPELAWSAVLTPALSLLSIRCAIGVRVGPQGRHLSRKQPLSICVAEAHRHAETPAAICWATTHTLRRQHRLS
jgi:hypothetical protein